MHSRIFEISTDPILHDEHMTENDFDYDHWFFHDVADYVTDDANRDSSVEWLYDSITVGDGLITVDGDSFILHEGYQAAYWGDRYKAFVQLAETLQSITFEEFAQGGVSVLLYQAEQLHEQKFELYVVTRESGDELITFRTLSWAIWPPQRGQISAMLSPRGLSMLSLMCSSLLLYPHYA